jgi:hypothetical protein
MEVEETEETEDRIPQTNYFEWIQINQVHFALCFDTITIFSHHSKFKEIDVLLAQLPICSAD